MRDLTLRMKCCQKIVYEELTKESVDFLGKNEGFFWDFMGKYIEGEEMIVFVGSES